MFQSISAWNDCWEAYNFCEDGESDGYIDPACLHCLQPLFEQYLQSLQSFSPEWLLGLTNALASFATLLNIYVRVRFIAIIRQNLQCTLVNLA